MSNLSLTPSAGAVAFAGLFPGFASSSPVLGPPSGTLSAGGQPAAISQSAFNAIIFGFELPVGQIGLPTTPIVVTGSQFVDFAPSTTSAFQFQPTLDGVQYNATVTFNVAGQRYYISINDLSGNLIVCRSLVSSGPRLQASFLWDGGITAAITDLPHNVPVGTVVQFGAYQTGTPFDGQWTGLAVDPNTLIYQLASNPNAPSPVSGTITFPLNLLAGYGIGWLLFHYDTQQFEFAAS